MTSRRSRRRRPLLARLVLSLTLGLLCTFGIQFSVAKALPDKIAFFALGDQGTGGRQQRAVAQAMETVASGGDAVGFVLLLGDNFYPRGVHSVTDPQWEKKFESMYSGPVFENMPFYALLGNHDRRDNYEAQIAYSAQRLGSGRWRMPARFYVRDFGNVGDRPLLRVAFLDTTPGIGLESQQAAMLRSAFTDSKAPPIWKIAAGHHPVRSVGEHGPTVTLLEWLRPVLQETKVDAYLSAHDHLQQVIDAPDEPVYIGAGGGGHRLYRVAHKDEHLKFAAVQHGPVKISVSETTLKIEFFDEKATRTHATTVRKP